MVKRIENPTITTDRNQELELKPCSWEETLATPIIQFAWYKTEIISSTEGHKYMDFLDSKYKSQLVMSEWSERDHFVLLPKQAMTKSILFC